MSADHSVQFFDAQFQRQVAASEFALNPFEQASLDHIRGRVLDLGCGLGNLSIEAARRGASVVAVDASPTAVERIRAVAERERLDVKVVLADVGSYAIAEEYDTIVVIGLVMFFRKEIAFKVLGQIKKAVKPGGRAIINVLIEGTTFMGMFDPQNYYLFGPDELERFMSDWAVRLVRYDSFEAPGNTKKHFVTIIAERPSGA